MEKSNLEARSGDSGSTTRSMSNSYQEEIFDINEEEREQPGRKGVKYNKTHMEEQAKRE